MRPTAVRWRIFGLIFLGTGVSYLLRTNMSIAGEPMMDDIGLTELQLGYILAAFAWGYAIFQIPGGAWGNTIGPRKALTIVGVLWGLVTLLTGLVPGPAGDSVVRTLLPLIVLRFLMGAFQAPIAPVGSGGTVARWFPPLGWGLPNGLLSTGVTLGAATTGPLVAWLTVTVGWRPSFLVMAPLGLLFAGWWWWYSRDHPAEHRSVNEAELVLISEGRTGWGRGEMTWPVWRSVLGNRDIVLLTVSYFCMNYVFYLFFNWFFFYLVDVRGFTNQQAGMFFAVQWIVGAVGATAGGFACDRLAARYGVRWGYRLLAMTGLLVTAPLLLAGSIVQDAAAAVVFLSMAFGATQITEAAFWTAATAVAGEYAPAGKKTKAIRVSGTKKSEKYGG